METSGWWATCGQRRESSLRHGAQVSPGPRFLSFHLRSLRAELNRVWKTEGRTSMTVRAAWPSPASTGSGVARIPRRGAASAGGSTSSPAAQAAVCKQQEVDLLGRQASSHLPGRLHVGHAARDGHQIEVHLVGQCSQAAESPGRTGGARGRGRCRTPLRRIRFSVVGHPSAVLLCPQPAGVRPQCCEGVRRDGAESWVRGHESMSRSLL